VGEEETMAKMLKKDLMEKVEEQEIENAFLCERLDDTRKAMVEVVQERDKALVDLGTARRALQAEVREKLDLDAEVRKLRTEVAALRSDRDRDTKPAVLPQQKATPKAAGPRVKLPKAPNSGGGRARRSDMSCPKARQQLKNHGFAHKIPQGGMSWDEIGNSAKTMADRAEKAANAPQAKTAPAVDVAKVVEAAVAAALAAIQ
jgi:hypothetical protein